MLDLGALTLILHAAGMRLWRIMLKTMARHLWHLSTYIDPVVCSGMMGYHTKEFENGDPSPFAVWHHDNDLACLEAAGCLDAWLP